MPRLILWVLIALIVFLPIPFAGVLPWTWSAMCLLIGLLLVIWGLSIFLGAKRPWHPPATVLIASCLFILAIVWALFQTIGVTPPALHHPLWQTGTGALGITNAGTISLDPAASRESALRILTYGAIFWLTLQISRNRTHAITLLFCIGIAVALNALYGLFVQVSGSKTILWYHISGGAGRLTGTFVNRNSFATYVGFAMVCTTGLLWHRLQSAVRGVTAPTERRRLLAAQLLERNGALLLGWFVLAVALLLTQSRAGVGATAIALLVLVFAMGSRSMRPVKSRIIPILIMTVAIVLIFRLSGEGLDVRLTDTGLNWLQRMETYDTVLRAVGDAPHTGTGLGTFESVFRFYGTVSPTKVLAKAHNDYLELALELGVPAMIIFISALALAGLQIAAGVVRRSRDFMYPCIGSSAIVLIGIHSLVDFSLQIPAVALSFSILLGAAAAQSYPTRA